MSEGTHVDSDGRDWCQDTDGTWYSPTDGLEFESFEELDEEYGPITAKEG